MKFILPILLAIQTANAAEIAIHSTSIYMILFFLLLSLIIMFSFYHHKCDKQARKIKEQLEQIGAFEAQAVLDEKETLTRKLTNEKEILLLNQTITDLERKHKEGTKHQIVAKIEALEAKRQNNTAT